MYKTMKSISSRPEPFSFNTVNELWNGSYTAQRMLDFHLNKDVDISSRKEEFITASVSWISRYFSLGKDSSVCDFGCGPGYYTTALARMGGKVTGIDISQNSIDYAKRLAAEENLDIDYRCQNYLNFSADSVYDLVTLIMCDYCALSPQQRSKLLSIFKKILKPSGAVLLDVYSLEAFKRVEEKALYEFNLLDGFWSADDYYGFLNTFKYESEQVALDKYTIIEPEKQRVIYNWLQYYSLDSLIAEIEAGGFEVTGVYSNVAGDTYNSLGSEFAIVATNTDN